MSQLITNLPNYVSWLLLAACSSANLYFIYCILYLRGLVGSAAAQSELGLVSLFFIVGLPIGLAASIALIIEIGRARRRSTPPNSIYSSSSIGHFINLLVPLEAWVLIWHVWR